MSLRRFSPEPERENAPIWALEVESGSIRRSSVRNEAAVTYYNLLDGAKTDEEPDMVEKAFCEVEGAASSIFDKISAGQLITLADRSVLALFLHLQYLRTPRGRENMRFVQSQAAMLYMRVKLSDDGQVTEFLETQGQDATAEAIAKFRAEMHDLLDSGDVIIAPGWNGEVLSQFVLTEEIPRRLCREMTWNVLRAPEGYEFIISDHPVHIYDPQAYPDRNGAWFSSPDVQATFPVDRKTCLVLTPGPAVWHEVEADAASVRDLNLKSLASSEGKCYGSSQRVLEQVWLASKENPQLMDAFRPKPPKIFLLEKASDYPGALAVSETITGPSKPEIRRFKRSET